MLSEDYSAPLDLSHHYTRLDNDYDILIETNSFVQSDHNPLNHDLMKDNYDKSGSNEVDVPPPLPRRPRLPLPNQRLERLSRRERHEAIKPRNEPLLANDLQHRSSGERSSSPKFSRGRRPSSTRSSWRSRLMRRRSNEVNNSQDSLNLSGNGSIVSFESHQRSASFEGRPRSWAPKCQVRPRSQDRFSMNDIKLQNQLKRHTTCGGNNADFVNWHSISPGSSQTSLDNKKLKSKSFTTATTTETTNTSTSTSLRPLFFEVPRREDFGDDFVGRNWLFAEIKDRLEVSKGVVLVGAAGTGKTEAVLRMVQHSCFREDQNSSPDASSLCAELGSRTISFHLCQDDCKYTLGAANFVANLAAQLLQCPLLTNYHEYIESNNELKDYFTMEMCRKQPDQVFSKAILQPFNSIRTPESDCIMLIDGVESDNELVNFLSKNANDLPQWLKIVVTQEQSNVNVANVLGLQVISLDRWQMDERIQRDLVECVEHRLKPNLASNLLSNQLNKRCSSSPDLFLTRFIDHVTRSSKGNMLYLHLVLDLIDRGLIRPKSSSFGALPLTLDEIFQLEFNIRFPIESEYRRRIAPLLEVCVAAEQPLRQEELLRVMPHHPYYNNVDDVGDKGDVVATAELERSLSQLSGLVTRRSDDSLTLFHSALKRWLSEERSLGKMGSNKFGCHVDQGHRALAIFVAQRRKSCNDNWRPQQTICVVRHVLKADKFGTDIEVKEGKIDKRDIIGHKSFKFDAGEEIWRHFSKSDFTKALIEALSNHCSNEDFEACRLLMALGADLEEVRNDVNNNNENIEKLLISACNNNHVSKIDKATGDLFDEKVPNNVSEKPFVRMKEALKGKRHSVNALLLAMETGNIGVVQKLLNLEPNVLREESESILMRAAEINDCVMMDVLLEAFETSHVDIGKGVQNAFVEAAKIGALNSIGCLARLAELDASSSLHSMSALTAATLANATGAVALLLELGASDSRALLAASKSNNLDILALLLTKIEPDIRDKRHQRTPLMIVCSSDDDSSHSLAMLDALLAAGADVLLTDQHGISALGWACLHGHYRVFAHLLGALPAIIVEDVINKVDKGGRTLLNLAAYSGQVNIVKCLIDLGATIELADSNNVRPLDRAVSKGHRKVIDYLLQRGASIAESVWTTARTQPEILLLLLDHLVARGASYLGTGDPGSASECYAEALRQLRASENCSFRSWSPRFACLQVQLLLNLSRCERKLHRRVEAVHLAQLAVDLDPERHQTRCVLAKALMESNRLEEALIEVKTAKKIAENIDEVQTLLTKIENDVICRLRNHGKRIPYEKREVNSSSDSALSSSS